MNVRHRNPIQPGQRGVVLIVVLALVLLTSLVLLGSTRQAWLNDKFVGAEADHERAFAAAEALIRDAELDIQGLQANGLPCSTNPTAHCRGSSNNLGLFPIEDNDLDALDLLLDGKTPRCLAGLCMTSPDFDVAEQFRKPETLKAMQAAGATYGRFTAAQAGVTGNPLLGANPAQAWYWIEVLRYSSASAIQTGTQGMPVPDPVQPFLYRINAYVKGLKPGTAVYLRSVFIPRPLP